MLWIKQATAVILKMGPFVDAADAVTPEEELSIGQSEIQISKNGGAFAQTSAAAPTTTHDADGWYPIPLTATDTGTLGTLKVQVTMAGALPVWQECMVLPANVYDSMVSGTDKLDTATVEWNGVALGTTNPLPNAAADAAGGLPISDAGGLDLDAKLANTNEVTAARMGALTDLIDGGRLDLLIDAIKAKTDLGLLNTTWTDAKAGYLDEAISAAKTLTAAYEAAKTAAQAGDAMALTAGERTTLAAAIEAAIINELDGTAVMQAIADLIASDMTTGDLSVQAIAAAVRDAILDRVLAGNHDTPGTAGKLLQTAATQPANFAALQITASGHVSRVTLVDTTTANTDMRGTDNAALASVCTEVRLAELDPGNLPADVAAIPTNPYTGTPPTAGEIADQVWDEAVADHLGAGSTGAALNAAGASGDPWNTALPGAYGVGTAGKIVGDRLDEAVSAAKTLTAAYEAAKTAAQAGDQMDLVDAPNATARTAIGVTLEAMMLDEGDATALLAAIAAKVEEFLINEGDAAATIAAIAAACNSAVAAGTVGTQVGQIHGKLPSKPYLTATDAASGAVDLAAATGNVAGTVGGVAGTVSANVAQILGSALSEAAAGRLAAAIAYFFDVATPAKTINDVGSGGAGGATTLAANGLDSVIVEGAYNARQALALMLAALAGNITGVGDSAPVVKAAGDSDTTRISATTDSDGNRTVTALTPPA